MGTCALTPVFRRGARRAKRDGRRRLEHVVGRHHLPSLASPDSKMFSRRLVKVSRSPGSNITQKLAEFSMFSPCDDTGYVLMLTMTPHWRVFRSMLKVRATSAGVPASNTT